MYVRTMNYPTITKLALNNITGNFTKKGTINLQTLN